MPTNEQHSHHEELESLLDRYSSPEAFLDALSTVAAEKADHVRSNWQDEPTARAWEKWSNKVADFSTRMGQRIGNPYGSVAPE